MATPVRVTSTYISATKALFSGLGVAVPFAAVPAVFAVALDKHMLDPHGGRMPGQDDLIGFLLPMMGFALVLELLWGPIQAAAAVYVAKCHADGKSPGLYGAVNFALSRYGKVFPAHAGAQLSIQLGMVVLIPGILFMCMYAFVDPVACLEKEKWAMGRSSKLTRGRRKTVLWVSLPVILYMQGALFVNLWAYQQGAVVLFVAHLLSVLAIFWLSIAYTQMYLKRVTPGVKKPEDKVPAGE
jgi:hypothetical protein